MQFTISIYDEKDKCKVCGSRVSERHKDGCEVGALRKELVAAQQSRAVDVCSACAGSGEWKTEGGCRVRCEPCKGTGQRG